MKLIEIYKCLCDETRLRILNLLSVSPLCVCHLQEVLGKSQVTMSQHLSYLRERNLVTCQTYQTWRIYSLPSSPSPELASNLKCLQDCVQTEPVFQEDRKKLQNLMGSKSVSGLLDEGCCPRITSCSPDADSSRTVSKTEAK